MEAYETHNQITSYLDDLKSLQNDDINIFSTKCEKPKITSIKQDIIESTFHAKCRSDNSSGTTEDIIIQCDRRIKVEKPSAWPYSAHCLLRMKFGSQDYHSGSATLIAPNLAITAAHNLYCIDEKEEIKLENLAIFPGADGTVFPYKAKVKKFYYPKKYVTSNGTKEDFGLLILDKEVGFETGYYGLCSLEKDIIKTVKINVTGYPCDKVKNKPFTHEMWGMDGDVHNVDLDHISYLIDTYGGQSGSGVVWKKNENEYYVIGVHVLGDKSANKATYFTKRRIAQIQGWLESYATELAINTSNLVTKERIEMQFDEEVTEDLITKLAQTISKCEKLKVLKLNFAGAAINDKLLIQIADSLKCQPNLTVLSLNLKGNDITNKSLIQIAEPLKILGNLVELELNLKSTSISNKALIQIAEALKNYKTLIKLSLNLKSTEINDKSFIQIAEAIQNHKKLAELVLNLKSTTLNDNAIIQLAEALDDHEDLRLFSLTLAGNTNVGEKCAESLKKNLKNLENLSELELNFSGTKITNTSLIEIAKILKKKNKIQDIETSLDYFCGFDDGPILKLQISTDKTKKSLNLRLNLTKANIKVQSLNQMIETVKKNPKMSKFDLDLKNSQDINDELVFIISEILKKAINITEFKLTLFKSNIHKESVINIMDYLKDKKNLTKFELNLTETETDNEAVIHIANILKDKSNLSTFSLRLSQTEVDDISIIKLAETLKDKQNLTSFDLYLSGTKVTDESLSQIGEALKNKVNMTYFVINLKDTSFGDNALMKFTDSFKEMMYLEKFEIFIVKTKITDASMKIIAEIFKNHTNMKIFNLGLGITKVGDGSMIKIANTIGSMQNIEKTELWLSKTKVSDDSIEEIADALKNNTKLKGVKITLSETDITNSSIQKLAEVFKDKPQIELIDLDLSKTDISDNSLKKLTEVMKNKEKLEEFYLNLKGTNVTKSKISALESVLDAEYVSIISDFEDDDEDN